MFSQNKKNILSTIVFVVTLVAVVTAEKNTPKTTVKKSGITQVTVIVDPAKVLGKIDEKVYGHFLEPYGHCVSNGLWGEMVWNRSFEELPETFWVVKDNVIEQSNTQSRNNPLIFGDAKWSDYELTLEMQKTGGIEGSFIMFRVSSKEDFYWYNIGGWGNTRHRLEKGIEGKGWSGLGPIMEGSIETGKWYRIRVRCEGSNISVWIDEKPVLNYTDENNPHLLGCVGLSTWNTSACYRNLKVTSLDGKTLFEGIPQIVSPVSQQVIAPYWESYGDGKFQIITENPLNSEFSLVISALGNETGVKQNQLNVRSGHTYHGSLWACGEAGGEIVVRLLSGETKLAEVSLSPPRSEWDKYKFQLRPKLSTDNATLQIGVKGKTKIWLDQVSLMSESSKETGGFRPDLLKAVADLKPPIIRWPGGCFAQFYRWKSGIGPQHKRIKYPIVLWGDQDTNCLGTDEFVQMCRQVGAEPLIVINSGCHDKSATRDEFIQEACDWVEYCNGPSASRWGKVRAANGHPESYNVKYWEIDNETWGMDAREYAESVRQFVSAIKKVDPSIKIVACGSADYSSDDRIGLPWNREVLKVCADVIDYLSIHHYEDPDKFAEGPMLYEEFFRKTGELIANSANKNVKIYCSEWNAHCLDWRGGLYAGGLLNSFERCSDIFKIGGPAVFLRPVTAKDWDLAFINFDQSAWFPAPSYVVMKLWREHYAPDRVFMNGEFDPLNAICTKSADGQRLYLKCVNPSAEPMQVQVKVDDSFPVFEATMKLIAPASLQAHNSLSRPEAVSVEQGNATISGQIIHFTMPCWSVAVTTIERMRY